MDKSDCQVHDRVPREHRVHNGGINRIGSIHDRRPDGNVAAVGDKRFCSLPCRPANSIGFLFRRHEEWSLFPRRVLHQCHDVSRSSRDGELIACTHWGASAHALSHYPEGGHVKLAHTRSASWLHSSSSRLGYVRLGLGPLCV